MARFLFLVLAVALAAASPARAGESIQARWSATYGSTGTSFLDRGDKVAFDAAGNVVAGYRRSTGRSSVDWSLVKYTAAGVKLWERASDNPQGQKQTLIGLALDAQGNAVVLVDAPTPYAAKYAQDTGELLWFQALASAAGEAFVPSALALDAAGDVLLTGKTGTVGFYGIGSPHYDTRKLRGDTGAQLWAQDFVGVNAVATHLAVAPNGGTIVLGSIGQNNSTTPHVIKYDAAGARQWEYDGMMMYASAGLGVAADGAVTLAAQLSTYTSFNGHSVNLIHLTAGGQFSWNATLQNTTFRAMALDPAGDLFLATLDTSNADHLSRYAAANGTVLWARRGDTQAGYFSRVPIAAAVDGQGNVVVTGYDHTSASGVNATITIAYAGATGDTVWRAERGNPACLEGPAGLAIDGAGNVAVTGTSQDPVIGAFVATFATGSGAAGWAATFHGAYFSADEITTAKMDAAGNLYMATAAIGSIGSQPGTPGHLLKYAAADGALLWDHTLSDRTTLQCLTFDAAGQLAAAGVVGDSIAGGLFAGRYSAADGSPIWEKSYDGGGATGLVLDAAGNLFVNGYAPIIGVGGSSGGVVTITAPTPMYTRTMKLAASDGAVLWSSQHRVPPGLGVFGAVGSALAIDSHGDVVLGCADFGTQNSAVYLAKYAGADGQIRWERSETGPQGLSLVLSGLRVDAADAVLTTGGYYSLTGPSRTGQLTSKYAAADGQLVWQQDYPFAPNQRGSTFGLALNAAGDATVLGQAPGGVAGGVSYLLHYAAADGHELWRQSLTDGLAFKVTTTSAGRVLVSGVAYGSTHYLALLDDATGDLLGEFREAPYQQVFNVYYYGDPSALVIGPSGTFAVCRDASVGSDIDAAVTFFEPATDAPTVTLAGDASLTLELGLANYVDAGATAIDALGGTLTPTSLPARPDGLPNLFPIGTPGTYRVNYTATDARGLIGAASRTVHVVDTVAPTIYAPDITLEATAAAGNTVDAYAPIITDADTQLTITYDLPAPQLFPLGATPVKVTATDRAGHSTSATFTVTVRDTTPPTISAPSLPLSAGRLYDLRSWATVHDVLPVTITQSPAPGTWVEAGPLELSFTATDAAGNSATTAQQLTVAPATLRNDPVFIAGTAAPGAGQPNGPPARAYLTRFGVPAIDQDGNIAFTAGWAVRAETQRIVQVGAVIAQGSGLFTKDRAVAQLKGAVPGLGGATFAFLYEPVIDSGHVAFLATLAGSAPGAAVCSDAPTGQLQVIARAGQPAPGLDRGRFISFRAVAVAGSAVVFQGSAVDHAGRAVNGLWAQDATQGLALLLRDGVTIGGRKIKTLASFMAGNGSPGQGRGWLLAPAGEARVQAIGVCDDGSQVLLTASFSTAPALGLPVAADLGFRSHGVPAWNAAGTTAWLATRVAVAGAAAPFGLGIFDNLAPAQTADPVALVKGAGVDATLRALKDSLLAAESDSLLFCATVALPHLPVRTSLLYQERDDRAFWPQPLELTYTGADAPDLPGFKFTSFTSLALPSARGPVVAATVAKGKVSDQGVWAVGTDGQLALLFHRGTELSYPQVKVRSFTLLNALAGSQGVARSYNEHGQLVWRATAEDGSEAIVLTQIP